jgi:hypothetical protein
MRIDPDTCDDPVLLAAEVRRLRAVIANGDYLKADNAAKRDKALQALAELDEELGLPSTPNPHATPAECTVPDVHLADARAINTLLERTRNG